MEVLYIFWMVLVSMLAVSLGKNIIEIDDTMIKTTVADVSTNQTIIEKQTVGKGIDEVKVAVKTPDDYLNWFFHHSFKKLDDFFQQEHDRESERTGRLDPVVIEVDDWKIRVSKVILKLILVLLAIVSSVIFILGIFLFMFLAFVFLKLLGHCLQFCREQKSYKSNSTTYQVNL